MNTLVVAAFCRMQGKWSPRSWHQTALILVETSALIWKTVNLEGRQHIRCNLFWHELRIDKRRPR